MIEKVTLQPGMKVVCKPEVCGVHVWLADSGHIASPGHILNLTSIKSTGESTNLIDSQGNPMVRYTLGFKECCKKCRAGEGHHETFNPMRFFEEVVKTAKSSFNFVDAADIIQIIYRLTAFWNPDMKTSVMCLHFGNFRYEVIGTQLESVRITKKTYYSLHEEDFSIGEEIPEDSVLPILSYFSVVESTLDKVEKDMDEAEVIIRKINGAVDEKQAGKEIKEEAQSG